MQRQVRGTKVKSAARFRKRSNLSAPRRDYEPRYISNLPKWSKRVYAICFDLDTEVMKSRYHNDSWQNGYGDVFRVLQRHGFDRQQGSVYFGDDKVDPVICVLAVQDVVKECPWFPAAVRDIRMLRIEENNDLMPAVGDPVLPLENPPMVAAE
jgi:virulence-associated protein VapD